MTAPTREQAQAARRVLEAATAIRRARDEVPMATSALWHRDRPGVTSQRTAFATGIGELIHFVVGGKGSGKTEGAIQVAAAMARGRQDPEVQIWARRNGFPLTRIPPEPKYIIVSAASHQISKSVLRPLFARLMPRGTTYLYWNAPQNEASATLPNGCFVRFMAGSQPREQFQSMAVDFALIDEEHTWDIVGEILARVIRRRWAGSTGWALMSATPVTAMQKPGMSWIYEKFEVERPDGYTRAEIHGLDNPYLDRGAREALLSSMTAGQRGMEEQGKMYSPGGLVFEEFSDRIHVVPPTKIPHEYRRMGALDIGTSSPTGYLGAAYDPEADVLHIYAGHYKAHPDPAIHAAGIQQAHGAFGEAVPPVILADLNTPGTVGVSGTPDQDAMRLAHRYREAGIMLRPADKAFGSGVAAVNERMMVRDRGRHRRGARPGLVIHNTPALAPLIQEIRLYSWSKHALLSGRGHDTTQGADHACDPLRYLCQELWTSGAR